MMRTLVEDLNKVLFLLRSHSFSKAIVYVEKAVAVLAKTPEEVKDNKLREDYHKVVSSLSETISSLRKCASTTRPGDPQSCVEIAREVYRQSLLLHLVATGEIHEIRRARRYAYITLALGLPTGALFGLSPVAAGLIFMGALWTYFHFARLRLIGWIVLVSSLMLLLPFLVNATLYFAGALFNPEELSTISSELGVGYHIALLIVSLLLFVSTTALLTCLLSLKLLFKYRVVFK